MWSHSGMVYQDNRCRLEIELWTDQQKSQQKSQQTRICQPYLAHPSKDDRENESTHRLEDALASVKVERSK